MPSIAIDRHASPTGSVPTLQRLSRKACSLENDLVQRFGAVGNYPATKRHGATICLGVGIAPALALVGTPPGRDAGCCCLGCSALKASCPDMWHVISGHANSGETFERASRSSAHQTSHQKRSPDDHGTAKPGRKSWPIGPAELPSSATPRPHRATAAPKPRPLENGRPRT